MNPGQLAEAVAALQSGDPARAEALVRHHLGAAPDDPDALRLLAAAAVATGRFAEAEPLLERAIAVRPRFALAHADLASLLCRMARADDALAILDRAIEQAPAEIWPLSIKSGVLAAERRDDEALAVHEALVKRAPRVALLWTNYAHALHATGKAAPALTAYRTALELDPSSGSAWLGLANLRARAFGVDDIRSMERALSGVRDPSQRAQMLFALGRARTDQGAFEQAFDCYTKANGERAAVAPYDPQILRDAVAAHRALDPGFFRERHGAGHDADDVIFIVGMPRSGSTLVEQMLSSHPMVEAAGELFELQEIAATIGGGTWAGLPAALARLTPDERKGLGQRYLAATRRYRRTDRPCFTDKMPANWRFIALIHLILPNARIVDVRRAALPCCFSAFSTYFNRQTSFPASLRDLGEYYRGYADVSARIDEFLPDRVHRLSYEELVDRPEDTVRGLLDHLGLPFASACLDFHDNPRAVHTPIVAQVRRPIDRSNLESWRDFEPWLAPLKAGLASTR